MTANNMAQLESMIRHDMEKAMNVVGGKSLEIMHEQTGNFYTGGEPKVYQRTGALANTPRTTAISSSGNTVSFQAYLDQNHTYTTGRRPHMIDILHLTNDGSWKDLRPAVGKTGYWDRAEDQIEQTFYDTMRMFFN